MKGTTTKIRIPDALSRLADRFEKPLYVTGGFVRNSLLGLECNGTDIDVCSATPARDVEEMLRGSEEYAVTVKYKRLGTLLIKTENGECYEYTNFRREFYGDGGEHAPCKVEPTDDVAEDARRRDLTVNAIYYDVKGGCICDPLGGIEDLRSGILRAADRPSRVFSNDGERLLRLARFAAELNFEIDEATFLSAAANCEKLADIAEERKAAELMKLFFADTKYPLLSKDSRCEPENVSPEDFYRFRGAHTRGVVLLDRLGLLPYCLPELLEGKGLAQRSDFHKFDVFNHTLATFAASKPSARIAALLHDVAKPKSLRETGIYAYHGEMGKEMSFDVCRRLGMSKKDSERVSRLVLYHMYDVKNEVGANKLKRFAVKNFDLIDALIDLKQADYEGGGYSDENSIAPGSARLMAVKAEILAKGTPIKHSDLAISGADVSRLCPALPSSGIGDVLDELFWHCALDERLNSREWLEENAVKIAERYGKDKKSSGSNVDCE